MPKIAAKQPELGEQTETIEQLTKQVAKGGSIVFIGNVLGRGIGFVLQIVLARFLGPAAYGLYALGMSTAGIARLFALLGIPRGVVRFGAAYLSQGDKQKLKGMIIASLGVSLIGSVIVGLLLFLFAETVAIGIFREPNLTKVIKIFALGLPFYVLIGITSSVTQAFQRMEYSVAIGNIFQPITNLILIGIIFLLGYRLYGAIWGLVASAAFSAIVGLYLIWKLFPEVLSALKPHYNRELLKFSLPMIFITMSYFLAFRTDRIMVGIFLEARDVGIYSAAANVALQLAMFHAAIAISFAPVISKLYDRGLNRKLEQIYNLVAIWGTWAVYIPFILIVLFSREILGIFGKEFVEGSPVLIILALTWFLGTVPGQLGQFLQMTSNQKLEFFNSLILVGGNIGLNLVFIPMFGVLGAALATLCASVTTTVVQLIEIRSIFGFHPFKGRYLKFLAFAGFLILITWLWFSGLSIFARIGAAFAIIICFLTSVYFLKTRDDIVIFEAVKQKLSLAFGGNTGTET